MASYLRATTELAAGSAGSGLTKLLPGAGLLLDGAAAKHDNDEMMADYQECMEHN
jgi:hypothetical protein